MSLVFLHFLSVCEQSLFKLSTVGSLVQRGFFLPKTILTLVGAMVLIMSEVFAKKLCTSLFIEVELGDEGVCLESRFVSRFQQNCPLENAVFQWSHCDWNIG